jgi:predicted dehydrogenase
VTFRIGVVGAGAHGERYVRHGQNDVPGMSVSALCRRQEKPGQELASQYGVRHHREALELIADPDVDGVVICTPPSTHFAYAKAVLAAGKPLLLEKPMTGTVAEAEALARLDETVASPLMVGQSLRWNPVIKRVKEMWPRLGRVRLIRLAQRLAPTDLAWQKDLAQTVGGSVLLTGVHIFDLARWLSESEFVSVDSRQEQYLNPVVEDFFLARAQLANGCWASLEVSKHTQSRACWLEVVGDKGQIRADYLNAGVLWRSGSIEEYEEISAKAPTLPTMLAEWLRSIRQGTPPPVTVHDGLATLRMVDACYESARIQASVKI